MSAKKPTHYDILGVKEGSSPKEIRSAFLSLSKAHHPDLHVNDPTKHQKYVRIMEAYTVLSKPELRGSYDADLRYWTSQSMSSANNPNRRPYDPHDPYDLRTNAPRYTTWRDESIWEMRNREHDQFYTDRSYYGIRGVNRVPNLWIAGGALWLMACGALFTAIAIKKSATFTVAQLDRRDARLGKEWAGARNRAEKNGNDLQLSQLESKLAERER